MKTKKMNPKKILNPEALIRRIARNLSNPHAEGGGVFPGVPRAAPADDPEGGETIADIASDILLEERTIRLTGEVTDGMALEVCERLRKLDMKGRLGLATLKAELKSLRDPDHKQAQLRNLESEMQEQGLDDRQMKAQKERFERLYEPMKERRQKALKAEIRKGLPPIIMEINSPGGSVTSGFAIYDVMCAIKTPIITIGSGMQASMGATIMQGGTWRYVYKDSSFMVHGLSSGTEGKTGKMALDIEYCRRLEEQLKDAYVSSTGRNRVYWGHVFTTDTFLSPENAVKIGLIDGIIPDFSGEKFRYAGDAESWSHKFGQ
ncbi:MAG: ATP-dependent Clp protease proteolytic subunit [Pseudomonadota bacterium]